MTRFSLTSAIAVAALAVAAPALAGPPLLCHPYDIGGARSLPWSAGAGWNQPSPDYNLKNLVADTESLLSPSTPIIVRMETLRRASIYASADAQIARDLLSRLMARATGSEKRGHPEALAFLDAAYLTEAFNEITMLTKTPPFQDRVAGVRAAIGSADGRALIAKSLWAEPDNPTLHFAAALISSSDRSAYEQHAAKARAGAAKDPLLAKNIDHVS